VIVQNICSKEDQRLFSNLKQIRRNNSNKSVVDEHGKFFKYLHKTTFEKIKNLTDDEIVDLIVDDIKLSNAIMVDALVEQNKSGYSLNDIGYIMGISRERVGQIKDRAINKIKYECEKLVQIAAEFLSVKYSSNAYCTYRTNKKPTLDQIEKAR
jgi:hypothetical protein